MSETPSPASPPPPPTPPPPSASDYSGGQKAEQRGGELPPSVVAQSAARLGLGGGLSRETPVLEFMHLFKGFRLAINPAKIVVGLLAVVLIYISGCAFDLLWGPQVMPNEISAYQTDRPEQFQRRRAEWLEDRVSFLTNALQISSDVADEHGPAPLTVEERKYLADHPASAYRTLRGMYEREFHDTLNKLAKDREQPGSSWDLPVDDKKSPAEREREGRVAAANTLQVNMERAHEKAGLGIFESLADYELAQGEQLMQDVLAFIRVAPLRHVPGAGDETDLGPREAMLSTALVSQDATRFWNSDTVAGCLANMTITGPCWLWTSTTPLQWRPTAADTTGGWIKMWLYRLLYIGSLAVLVLFWFGVLAFAGAVICRASALEFAGNDKASLVQIIYFAMNKFWHFVRAPLMPFAILLVIGVLVAVVALLGALPFIGEIIVGVVFIVFLIAGFVVMLLALGMLGGMQLLYPTIAVEGSDSFDAMSRSFAYVYARPWRLLFYTLLSLVYGTVCFLFVLFAVYLLLAFTHAFLGWGMTLFGVLHGAYSGTDKLSTIWPAPAFGQLWGPVNWWAMNWSEYLGACCLHAWLFVVFAGVMGFGLSFFHSSNTIIYFLLRRGVDGQSLTEVFDDEGGGSPGSAPAVPEAAASGVATAVITPP